MTFQHLTTHASYFCMQFHGLLAQGGDAAGNKAGEAGAGEAGKKAADKVNEGGLFGGGIWQFAPFLIIAVLFYFMLIRPQRRKQQVQDEMMSGLKKNDRVVTAGGIIGVVVQADKDKPEITVRVDENSNTRLRMLRSSIARVIQADDDKAKDDD